MRYASLALLLLAACPRTSATTPADDEPIRVRLDRPEHVNRRFRVRTRTVNQQSEELAPEGQPPQRQEMRIVATLEGEAQVVALNEDGRQQELQVTIESFTIEVDGQEQSPLPRGTVVRVVRGEPSRILIDGEDVEGQLAEILGLVLPDGPDRDEDATFGTDVPRRVGDSWPIDPEATAAMLEAMRLEADDSAIDGTMTLASRDETTYRVEGRLDVNSMRMPMPPNTTLESANLESRFEWKLPIDETAPVLESLTELRMNVRLGLRDAEGRRATLTARTVNQRSDEFAPLPDGEDLEPSPPRSSNFGTVRVEPGFEPDPARVRGTSGGPQQAATLGEGCVGSVSDIPDHRVVVASGLERIRVMVHSPGDVSLVVQAPDGTVLCSDDDDGTDPIVELEAPAGEYRIFVGEKAERTSSPYVFAVTARDDVMPSTLLTPSGRPEADEENEADPGGDGEGGDAHRSGGGDDPNAEQ